MKKILGLCAVSLLCAMLVAGAAQAGKRRQHAVNLTFATYVWQPTTVTAMKNIVESWNKSNPNIQVQIVPVDVNAVHDKLLTSFVGGAAADIVHDEAADIPGFTAQGYLANLNPLIPKSLRNSIPKKLWDTVNFGRQRGITGVPLLMQTYNVFANMDLFKQAGIKAPKSDKPWTWEQFRSIAKRFATGGNYGVCWGLRSPTALINTTSLNYGGQWFYLEGGRWNFKWGAAEQKVPQTIHDMIYVDKSVDPAAVGLSGSAVLPAFFAGKCAMTVQGNFQAQGMISQSPKGFNWAMFPPLKGQSQDQAANPQTLSISSQSKNKKEAMQFIAYVIEARNIAKLAAGDWLIPSNPAAGKIIRKSTKHPGSWRVATESVVHLRKANWVSLSPYARWKAEYATPQFVQYLRNQISLEELGNRLSSGWNTVRG